MLWFWHVKRDTGIFWMVLFTYLALYQVKPCVDPCCKLKFLVAQARVIKAFLQLRPRIRLHHCRIQLNPLWCNNSHAQLYNNFRFRAGSSQISMAVLSLPREVRDMVYHLCLVVEYVIVPYPTKNEIKFRGPSPCVALLGVNKTISAETRPILYRHNKWQIGLSSFDSGSIYYLNPSFFEHVVLKLSGDDDQETDRMSTISRMHDDLSEEFLHNSRGLTEAWRTAVRKREIHSRLLGEVEFWWEEKTAIVSGLHYLRSITIDVSRLFCPSGCCRFEIFKAYPFPSLWDWFMLKNEHVYGPKVFFVGLRNKKESCFIYKNCGFKKWALDTYEMDGRDIEIDVTRQHPIEEEYSEASDSGASTKDSEDRLSQDGAHGDQEHGDQTSNEVDPEIDADIHGNDGDEESYLAE